MHCNRRAYSRSYKVETEIILQADLSARRGILWKGDENLKDKLQISLAAARVNAGMTQQDVAEIMHISKQTIVNWEKGKNPPKIAQLEMMSRLYNMPVDNIFLPEV